MSNAAMRKIIHMDMDAFYASVELRDRPELRDDPVVVAWDGPRSVVCAASYVARDYGIHSAMSVARAKQLCPKAVFIAPDFSKYRTVSQQVHTIFKRYTDLIEPLSLDEAYLDVTQNHRQIPSATFVAQQIRQAIASETGLTASAGVAPNKFVAKIASDWHKPNGIKVVSPEALMDFLLPLPVKKIPGVGRVTVDKMARLKIFTVADLARLELGALVHYFGRYGYRLYQLARGIDHRPVVPHREPKQISSETTFEADLRLEQAVQYLPELAAKVAAQAERKGQFGYCVTLKLKTHDFRTLTRSTTLSRVVYREHDLLQTALSLVAELEPELRQTRYRLVGIGMSQFLRRDEVESQLRLF